MRFVPLLLLLSVGLGCDDQPEATTYEVRGRVVGVEFGGLALRVDHEAIDGYMEAMRMSFPLQNPEDARLIRPGDAIAFDYHVMPTGSNITNIVVLPEETELALDHLAPGDSVGVGSAASP